MVKETKFRHHPARIEKGLFLGSQQLDILGIKLAFMNNVLKQDTGVGDANFAALDLGTLVTVPPDAVAVILSVKVEDTAAGSYMKFVDITLADSRQTTVYVPDANKWGSRIVIVQIDDNDEIFTAISAADSDFKYVINLIAWLIGGTRVSRVTYPYADLYAKFTI